MSNIPNVNQLKTKSKSEPHSKNNSDNFTYLDEIKQYTDERSLNQRVTDDHSRATFLIDNESLERLDDLVDYMEALGAQDGELVKTKGKGKDLNKYRILSKNFKSRFINFCIKEGLANWIDKEESIPQIDRVRFPLPNETYNRAFRIVDEKDIMYYTEQDNRGHEIKYWTTDPNAEEHQQASEDYINKLFEHRYQLEQQDLQEKNEQRKQKKENKERQRISQVIEEIQTKK